MSVVSPHVLYVGTTGYDLRKVSSAWPLIEDPKILDVRFVDEPDKFVPFDRATFEAALQASLTALANSSTL